MIRFHLVPHAPRELCLLGQNSQKGAKGGLLEAIHVARRGRPHMGHRPDQSQVASADAIVDGS
jgi:hypothetical protein